MHRVPTVTAKYPARAVSTVPKEMRGNDPVCNNPQYLHNEEFLDVISDTAVSSTETHCATLSSKH
jgi:hypothetical protein